MPVLLPKELRDRFARLIGEGLSGREASRRLHVSAATGARWRQQIHASGAAPIARMGRPPGSGKLAPHISFFRELVAQDPDITLFELRDALVGAETPGSCKSALRQEQPRRLCFARDGRLRVL